MQVHRNPSFPLCALDQKDMKQMDPEEYLELNKNGNSRKNINVILGSYNRAMKSLGEINSTKHKWSKVDQNSILSIELSLQE